MKESPLFNLSMANKELFHSNFIAWFGNNYKKEFINLINLLLGQGTWPYEIQKFDIDREYNHFDICIKDTNNKPRMIIENKVKSIPTKKQLDDYRKKVNDDTCLFILLSITSSLHDATEIEGWKLITYKELSNKLKTIKLSNSYHNQLLEDYCEYIKNLQNTIEMYDKEELYFSPTDQIQKELRIHDVCGKRKVQTLYQKLLENCSVHQDLKDIEIVSNVKKLNKDNIMIGWGYSNEPLIEVKLMSNKDVIVIQIQGKQYRHAVEFFDTKIGDRIKEDGSNYYPSKKGINYLITNYSDILSLKEANKTPKNYPFDNIPYGQKKTCGYCKYCNGKQVDGEISCFVYQWISIPMETKCNDLIQKIIQDILKIKEIIKKR